MAKIVTSIIGRPGPPGTIPAGSYVAGGTDVAVTDGGTGASTAAAALANLGAEASGTSATHAGLTAAHGATGAVVGTTNIQTLTNKTLTSPAISAPTGLVKGDVGLVNVDNTADSAKPVSTAQQTALNLKRDTAREILIRLAATVATTLATAVDITGFSFAVAAGEVWAYDVYLRVVGNTGGITFARTAPAGTYSQIVTGSASSITTILASAVTGSGTLTAAFGTAVYVGWTEVHGTISATAAGTVQIQFAAGTAAQSVSVEVGSYLLARRIS